MPVFSEGLYRRGGGLIPQPNHQQYRMLLEHALADCPTDAERRALLRAEAIEITRHVTDGIRDLVEHDKRVRKLVLEMGALPLATWAESLDTLAQYSLPALQRKIAEMKRELEQGQVEGLPGTLLLQGKPSFTTMECFYKVVFALAQST